MDITEDSNGLDFLFKKLSQGGGTGFIPNWNNCPPKLPPLLLLNGQKALTVGNIAILCAHIGSGKSHLCESILSTALNPDAQNLGITACLPEDGLIAYFDTEREKYETWLGWQRTLRRAGLSEYSPPLKNFHYESVLSLNWELRRFRVQSIAEMEETTLIILDGAADFMMTGDVNNVQDSVETLNWIRNLANTFRIGILLVMHPNPKDVELKPRGHLGSEALRRAEFSFGLEKLPDGTRRLSSDFAHGKHRSGAASEIYFHWSDEFSMFVNCDTPSEKELQKEKNFRIYENVIRKILDENPLGLTYVELHDKMAEETGKSVSTMKKWIAISKENGLIETKMGLYFLIS